MKIRPVTHCSPYLTQTQALRIVNLLERNPRKVDASLLKKMREALEKARLGDEKHAQWLASRSTS